MLSATNPKNPVIGRNTPRCDAPKATPKYLRLAQKLTREIEDGTLSPGDRLPSFSEINQQFGAATNTVDRAFLVLEQNGLVRREQGRGVFVAEPGRSNPKPKTGFIGLFGGFGGFSEGLPHYEGLNTSSFFSLHILQGIREILSREEKQLVLLNDDARGVENLDGVLACSTGHFDLLARRLPPGLPCVSLLLEVDGVPSVVADDYQGAKDAVNYLIELGHRRIACLMEFPLALPRLRAAGYHDALTEAGIALNPRWMHQPRHKKHLDQDYRTWGREGMRQWLQSDWQELGCTALLAQNDMVAAGVLESLQEAGIRVPEEVSVIGFDGTEICEYSSPQLSSVELPLRQIGTLAAQILLRQMQDDSATATSPASATSPAAALSDGRHPMTQVLSATLRVRQSTAAPPSVK